MATVFNKSFCNIYSFQRNSIRTKFNVISPGGNKVLLSAEVNYMTHIQKTNPGPED